MPGTRKTRIGLDGAIYRNSGTFASPTWGELTHVNDLSLTLETNEVDASDRSSAWETVEKGLQKATIEFDYMYFEGDTLWATLLDDWLDRDNPVEFAVMDGDITTSGEDGWRITTHVMSVSETQEKEGALKLEVTLRPAPNSDGNPQQYTVS